MGSEEEILMVYREHFEEKQYLQHGVRARACACRRRRRARRAVQARRPRPGPRRGRPLAGPGGAAGCGRAACHFTGARARAGRRSPRDPPALLLPSSRQPPATQIELREGDTIVDVGAHVGLFSIFTARAVGPSGRVLAVEPAPDTYACCSANVAANAGARAKAARVDVANVACGDGSVDKLTLTVYDRRARVLGERARGRGRARAILAAGRGMARRKTRLPRRRRARRAGGAGPAAAAPWAPLPRRRAQAPA
jgi:hypothetical protein